MKLSSCIFIFKYFAYTWKVRILLYSHFKWFRKLLIKNTSFLKNKISILDISILDPRRWMRGKLFRISNDSLQVTLIINQMLLFLSAPQLSVISHAIAQFVEKTFKYDRSKFTFTSLSKRSVYRSSPYAQWLKARWWEGGIFKYIHVLPDEFLFKSNLINLKKICWAKHEYSTIIPWAWAVYELTPHETRSTAEGISHIRRKRVGNFQRIIHTN
mgnify:FL=1